MADPSTRADIPAAIQAVWDQSREEMSRRVSTLEEAVAALGLGDLGDELRTRARRDAHRLAGSLGMFAMPAGSESAHEVERVLAPDGGCAVDAVWLAERVSSLRDALAGRRPPAQQNPCHPATDAAPPGEGEPKAAPPGNGDSELP